MKRVCCCVAVKLKSAPTIFLESIIMQTNSVSSASATSVPAASNKLAQPAKQNTIATTQPEPPKPAVAPAAAATARVNEIGQAVGGTINTTA